MPTPNVTPFQGYANTGLDNSLQFIRDVDTRLYYLEAFKYPLVSYLFTMGTELEVQDDGNYTLKGNPGLKKEKTVNPKFEHTESELLRFSFLPTAPVLAIDTSITIAASDEQFFIAGMELLLSNAAGQREVVRVTSIAPVTVNVTRNVGGTGAIAMAITDYFYNMGVVRAEDSRAADSVQAKSDTLFNYVEFIAESYGVTLIEQATANYNGDPYQRKKMEAFARMKQRMEMNFWFGVPVVDNAATNPIYHAGGILHFLENVFTNVPIVDNLGAALLESTWNLWLLDVLKHNSQSKVVFCSSVVLNAISGFATKNLRTLDVGLQKWGGLQIMEYLSPYGSVQLVREPLFDEVTNMNGAAVAIDMSNVKARFLEANTVSLDVKSYDDIQENDRAGRKGEWRGVLGLQVSVGKSHGILKNCS